MGPRRAILAILALAAIVSNPAAAQSLQLEATPDHRLALESIELRTLPRVDVESLLQENGLDDRKEGALRVGLPHATNLTPVNSGTWEQLPDGAGRWRLRVRSEGARWIVLGFDLFLLRPGALLSVYDPGERRRLGPFGASDVRPHGQLWLPPIDGDTVVVELHWPLELRGRTPGLRLATVSHGYKSAWGEDLDGSPTVAGLSATTAGACNIDVGCPLGDDFHDQARGVVQLLTGGIGFCTGTLIATTAGDCRPYLLTASHCIDTPQKAASTVFRFGYERSLCEAGDAPTDWTISGATLVATYGPSDFTLLELDSAVPEAYEPFYNGWTRSTQPSQASWGIHHPGNGVKKISHDADPLVHGQFWGSSHWRVEDWELGTTESGSSGSPLFDADGRVVGQLHGGYASCNEATWDEYGKFSHSWWGGSTPGTRLMDWLDPLGINATAIDGIGAAECRGDDAPGRVPIDRAPIVRRERGSLPNAER